MSSTTDSSQPQAVAGTSSAEYHSMTIAGLNAGIPARIQSNDLESPHSPVNASTRLMIGDIDDGYHDPKTIRFRWLELWSVAVWAIVGTVCRMELAQWLGESCANAPWIGWLATSNPLCISSDGIYRMGGIFFADFGANMVGCFLMGLLSSATNLGWILSTTTTTMSNSSSPQPLLGVVGPNSWFQRRYGLRVGLRCGFCGAMTTFSSWNTQMVVMMFGTGEDTNSAILKALFGYMIGMQTAVASLALGQSLARWIFGLLSPQLAAEEAAAAERTRQGVYIHPPLPEFERKFLPDLLPYLNQPVQVLEGSGSGSGAAACFMSDYCDTHAATKMTNQPKYTHADSVVV